MEIKFLKLDKIGTVNPTKKLIKKILDKNLEFTNHH